MAGGSGDAAAAMRRLQNIGMQLKDSQEPSLPSAASVFANVPQAPPDPILGVTEAFKADSDPRKLNLGVGAYRTEDGRPLVLSAVRKAEERLLGAAGRDKEYLPMGGNAEFCRLSSQLALGANSPALQQGRTATIQTLSGTGALRVAAEFLAQHYFGGRSGTVIATAAISAGSSGSSGGTDNAAGSGGDRGGVSSSSDTTLLPLPPPPAAEPPLVFLPAPTWGNHRNVFGRAGLSVRNYRYYKPSTRGLDYEGMLEDLSAAPLGAVVLLHACAHNPTGVDPTPDQWRGILQVVQRRRLLPLFDSAYQGFASGDVDTDAAAVRLFERSAGVELLLAQSYAKNMGLYNERAGALTVVTNCAVCARRVHSQLCQTVRPMWSSPPAHGAAIVALVLGDAQLRAELWKWKEELASMAHRIQAMRTSLFDALRAAGAPGDWRHILDQVGMFSFSGLSPAQCELLTRKWHIYLTADGRISMAGLSAARAPYLAEAIKDAVLTVAAEPMPR